MYIMKTLFKAKTSIVIYISLPWNKMTHRDKRFVISPTPNIMYMSVCIQVLVSFLWLQSSPHLAKVSNQRIVGFLFTDEFDAYIIVSFVNATLVLSIGETVEEVTDSGFLGTTPTLSCSLLGEDALVQVSDISLTYIHAQYPIELFLLPC